MVGHTFLLCETGMTVAVVAPPLDLLLVIVIRVGTVTAAVVVVLIGMIGFLRLVSAPQRAVFTRQ